jgi:hypothetical protein
MGPEEGQTGKEVTEWTGGKEGMEENDTWIVHWEGGE